MRDLADRLLLGTPIQAATLVHGVDRAGSMKPVSVDVITYAPTVFTHCQHREVAFGEVGIGERLRRQEAA